MGSAGESQEERTRNGATLPVEKGGATESRAEEKNREKPTKCYRIGGFGKDDDDGRDAVIMVMMMSCFFRVPRCENKYVDT